MAYVSPFSLSVVPCAAAIVEVPENESCVGEGFVRRPEQFAAGQGQDRAGSQRAGIADGERAGGENVVPPV